MNKHQRYQQWILLDQTGELSGWRRWQLRRALAQDQELQAWRNALPKLLAPSAAPSPPIPEVTMNRLREAAQDALTTTGEAAIKESTAPGWSLTRYALATLALIACLGAGWMIRSVNPNTNVVSSGTFSLEGLEQAIFDDDSLNDDLASVEEILTLASLDRMDDLTTDELAQALLAWEGESL